MWIGQEIRMFRNSRRAGLGLPVLPKGPWPHLRQRTSTGGSDQKQGFTCRTSNSSEILDDAGARRPGDRLQPGSSGFDSHRRFSRVPNDFGFRARFLKQAAGLVRPAARSLRCKTISGACSVQGFGPGARPGRGCSMVEHQVLSLEVAGSTPVHNTHSYWSGYRLDSTHTGQRVTLWLEGSQEAGGWCWLFVYRWR